MIDNKTKLLSDLLNCISSNKELKNNADIKNILSNANLSEEEIYDVYPNVGTVIRYTKQKTKLFFVREMDYDKALLKLKDFISQNEEFITYDSDEDIFEEDQGFYVRERLFQVK